MIENGSMGFRVVQCDFCGAKITEKDFNANTFGMWMYGRRGFVSYTAVSGSQVMEEKHSCDDELCKAKLLVWARS